MSTSARRAAPALSCVICTVDRPDMIGRAVRSVLRTATDIELIVVDQSHDERTRDACAEVAGGDERLRYVHTPRRGLSAASNLGIRLARADLVAFTDDDCEAHADWATQIVRLFDEHHDVEMIYGETIAAFEDATGVIPELRFIKPRKIGGERGVEVIGMGANFSLRRQLWERMGGFDETLGGGAELRSSQDFDFHYRACRAGATVLLSPEVKVDHFGFRSSDTEWERTLTAYGFGDGAFYWKHIRCRDLHALSLFARRVTKLLLREAVNPLRHAPSNRPYLRGLVSGVRASRRFPVDRRTRLYVRTAVGGAR